MMSLQGESRRRHVVAALCGVVLAGGGVLTAAASAADLATETPKQVLQATGAALKTAKGYEIHIDMYAPGSTEVGKVSYSHGDLALRVRMNTEKLGLVIIGKRAYFKASALFWVSRGSTKSLAKLFAPHWYKLPTAKLSGLTGGLGNASASTLTQCVAKNVAQLTNAGTSSLGGRSVVLLKSAGTAPGTRPETIAVAATGKPYLLRIAITGPTTPGPISPCNVPDADKQTGTETIDHWNSTPAVKAPPHAIKLPTK
jgi:hypothetical protein